MSAPPALVALSPGELAPADGPAFLEAARAAAGAGLRGILLREPALEDGPTLALARELARLLGAAGGWLGVADRVHVVLALAHELGGAGAPALAVQLGFRSLAPREARVLVGERAAVGFSSHAGDAPEAWEGADYLFFGPLLDTPSKRGLVEPAGFEALARRVAEARRPVLGIGGLRPEHAPLLRRAGASAATRADLLGAGAPEGSRGLGNPRAVAERARAWIAAMDARSPGP